MNLVAAFSTALSAFFAYRAVGAANKQVDAALEVVTRTEQTKYISDYVIAADNLCRELVPEELRSRLRYKRKHNPDGTIARPDYQVERRPDMAPIDLNKGLSGSIPNIDKAVSELSNKARLLVVWASSEKTDYDIYTFSLQLAHRALQEGAASSNTAAESFVRARVLCERWTDEAIAQYRSARK